MRLFRRTKKSRQPSQQPMSLVIPTQIAVGALGIGADLDGDVGLTGETSRGSSRIVLQDIGEVQRPHTSGVSTPVREREDEITSVHELRERKASLDVQKEQIDHIAPDFSPFGMEPGVRDSTHGTAQSGGSGGMEEDRNGGAIPTVVLVDDGDMGGFGTLRAVLKALYTNHRDIAVIGSKAKDLHSRVAALEAQFNSRPGDVKELNRRDEVIHKLKDIEKQLRLLSYELEPQQIADPVQNYGEFSEPFESLREIIFDYQVTRQLGIYEQGVSLIDPAEATVLNNFHCARGAEYRHGERKGCLKGTRGEVLGGIELWTRDFDKLPVYWLNGLAGTGKSTIAQTIAERTFASGQLGASFFCSRDFEDRSNLRYIFPTLAVQLARSYTSFRSAFISLVRSNPDIAHESLYNQMDKLIVQPLRESDISTVIVVDALDECKDEEPASAILSILGRFVSELSKVKFFITGRPEPRIRDGFRLPLLVKVTDIFVLHEVKSNQVDSDIRLFFKNSFLELTYRQPGLDDWPAKTQLDILCQRAAGFFVYAVATVKFIGSRNIDPRTRLDLLLQQPKSTIYEGRTRFNANNTLDSLYMSILQEAFNDIGPEDAPKVHSVLGAMILVENPLSPSSIATLLGFNVQDVTLLLSSIHSLLILHEDTNHPVRPFHKSFPDFITNPTRCSDQRFHIPPHHHLELLVGCLNLMNHTLEKNIFHLPVAVKNSEVYDLEWRTEQYLTHALQYACKSWHKHLVNEPSANRHAIASALHLFLEKKFLCWLEVLSVLGATKNAVDALQVAAGWLEESPTLDLVNDYLQFVTGFFEVISTSAPHIYHSALLLCPKESIVQKRYGSQANPMTRVIQGVPTSWDPIIATTRFPHYICATAWSPCSRFIAVVIEESAHVAVLDAITFERLHTMNPLQEDIEWDHIIFSPGSHLLTAYSWKEGCIISWDLQTGGLLSNISTPARSRCTSVSYSECETMIGGLFDNNSIVVYDVYSGMHRSSYLIQQSIYGTIWTCGQYLQYVTAESECMALCQVSFTSTQPPTQVGSLPVPDSFFPEELMLLPTLSSLAFIHNGKVLVWDAQNQKVLLESADIDYPRAMAFSPDGLFFACGTEGMELHIWKKSSTSYLPHQNLASGVLKPKPLFSPNGHSVISSGANILQLWHTISSPTSLPSTSIQASQYGGRFFVEFSPDESLVAVTEWLGCTVTILDMEFGNQWLVIDTDTQIYGLRVTENKVIVIGDGKIITWDLPARNCAFNTRRGIDSSIQTTTVQHSALHKSHASISPNLKYVAFGNAPNRSAGLYIHNMNTGTKLAVVVSNGTIPGFSSSGHEIWCATEQAKVDQWKIVEEDGRNAIKLEQLGEDTTQLRSVPWHTLNAYQVTDDGWILCSNGKRLLWLPHNWRPDMMMQRKWSGKFLAVWNGDSPKPYILKLEV